MRRFRLAVVGTAAFVAIAAVSGCSNGGGGSSNSTTVTPSKVTPTSTPTGAQAMVKTASSGKLGTILVSGTGRTLYLFEADKSTTSTCNGACAAAWPPLLTSGSPSTGGSAQSKLLGTSKRSDGKTQVTYNGHPLYLYAGDSKAGDTNGQALNQFGAEWYVLDAGGNKVDRS
ncbi:lipoprotein [Streptomyces humidus]|uniref:Lipoprotein n=2 Tax=Streptomyces humidus TaxID=52259 RepID=A0A918L533_9ACTN|nr:lipoprotein [Streptomyces humidus]